MWHSITEMLTEKGKQVLSKLLQAVVFLSQFFYLFSFWWIKSKTWGREEKQRHMLPNCHFLLKSVNKHLVSANPSARVQKLKALVNVSSILWFSMHKWPADVLQWGHVIFFIYSSVSGNTHFLRSPHSVGALKRHLVRPPGVYDEKLRPGLGKVCAGPSPTWSQFHR